MTDGMAYRWESHSVVTGERREGRAAIALGATEAAERAHKALGHKGVVTTVYGPRGLCMKWVPRERTSGMKWDRG